MKIRFLSDTYIRPAPSATTSDPIGVVYAGTVIEATPVEGETLEGESRWYIDRNGWYYWAGMVEAAGVPEESPEATGQSPLHVPAKPMEETPALRVEMEPPKPHAEQPHRKTAAPPTETTSPAPDARLNWALILHRLPEDWWAHGLRGNGIRLAVLGTGSPLEHPDLKHIVEARSFLPQSDDTHDRNGLGTQCAVTAAGAGEMLFGVAPEAELLIGKVGEQPLLITPDNLISGLEWALQKDAHVVLMLAEIPMLNAAQEQKLRALISVALSQGVPLIAPVGTTLSSRPVERYPAALKGVLSVGAHDAFEKRCAFSAVSRSLDLLAPGSGLNYSSPGKLPLPISRSTAIAAAYTAGVVVLAVQRCRQRSVPLDVTALYEQLRRTAIAKSPYEQTVDFEYGAGLLWPPELLSALSTD